MSQEISDTSQGGIDFDLNGPFVRGDTFELENTWPDDSQQLQLLLRPDEKSLAPVALLDGFGGGAEIDSHDLASRTRAILITPVGTDKEAVIKEFERFWSGDPEDALIDLGEGLFSVRIDQLPKHSIEVLDPEIAILGSVTPALTAASFWKSWTTTEATQHVEGWNLVPDRVVTLDAVKPAPTRGNGARSEAQMGAARALRAGTWWLDKMGLAQDAPVRIGLKASVTVGIVDSGVSDHKDLTSLDCQNSFGCWSRFDSTTPACGALGGTCKSVSYSAADLHGHGTQVAGAVASDPYGIHPSKTTILPLRAFDTHGKGLCSTVVACIDHARKKGSEIILGAWKLSMKDISIREAIDRHSKILFVFGAGNEGSGKNIDSHPIAPASWRTVDGPAKGRNNVCVVGGVERHKDNLGKWTHKWVYNEGPKNVDIAAPAQDLTTTRSDGKHIHGARGTSIAAGYVAGIAALYLSKSPGKSPKEVRQRLISTSMERGKFTKQGGADCGIVDAKKALS